MKLDLWSIVGKLSIFCWIALPVARVVWMYFVRTSTSFAKFKGEWAVISGSSRGIGRSFALALAKRGMNVCLISRNLETLEEVKNQCELFHVQCAVVEADLSVDASIEGIVVPALRSLPGNVSVLINNVGGKPPRSLPSAPNPCVAEYLDAASHESYFKFNVLPAARLTELLLEGMVQRNKGYVLNIASFNGLVPCPLLACYSASKAYVIAWSEAIGIELRARNCNVCVDVVCPGPVATDGIGLKGKTSAGTIANPDDFAERTLNLATTRQVKLPWPAHRWMYELYSSHSNFVPVWVAERWLFQAMMPNW